MNADLRSQLAQLLESSLPELKPLDPSALVIYGAGNAGRAAAAAAKDRGFQVPFFLDARAASVAEVDGIPCHLPESPAARAAATRGVPVVMAVFNCATDLQPIFALLRRTGFERVISFYEMHEHFGYEPQFWLGRREEYRTRVAEVLAGFDLFEDETSRQIYYECIALRLTFDLTLLARPDQENQYLPTDLPASTSPMRLIDGGAYTGDTLESFLETGVEFEAVAAFEPDLANFRQLAATVERAGGKLGQVVLMPCGLSNEVAIRQFSSGQGAGSSLRTAITEGLKASHHTHIQVVALDSVLPTFAPTLIKLDIEGAEPEALLGAQQMVARYRPHLAVCVYHAPEHLWTLPGLIRRLWPDYQLALRSHHFNGLEVVAYAFPR